MTSAATLASSVFWLLRQMPLYNRSIIEPTPYIHIQEANFLLGVLIQILVHNTGLLCLNCVVSHRSCINFVNLRVRCSCRQVSVGHCLLCLAMPSQSRDCGLPTQGDQTLLPRVPTNGRRDTQLHFFFLVQENTFSSSGEVVGPQTHDYVDQSYFFPW